MWYEATEIRVCTKKRGKNFQIFTLIKIKDFVKFNSTKPKRKF